MADKVKVKATVARHGDFQGFWCGGTFWPNGTSVQMVDADKVERIKAAELRGMRISVVAVGEEVKAEVTPVVMKTAAAPFTTFAAEGPGKKIK